MIRAYIGSYYTIIPDTSKSYYNYMMILFKLVISWLTNCNLLKGVAILIKFSLGYCLEDDALGKCCEREMRNVERWKKERKNTGIPTHMMSFIAACLVEGLHSSFCF